MSDEKKSEERNDRINTGGGAYIGGGVTNSGGINTFGGNTGTINYSQGNTTNNTTSGDTFNMSGDFRGSNLNIKSTLNNVTQSIGVLPNTDDATKNELTQLIAQLQAELGKVPSDKAAEAEKVGKKVEELVNEAKDPKADPDDVKDRGNALKRAADNLAGVLPTVVGIATSIISKLVVH